MKSFRIGQSVVTTTPVSFEGGVLHTHARVKVWAKSPMGRGKYRYQIDGVACPRPLWVDADMIQSEPDFERVCAAERAGYIAALGLAPEGPAAGDRYVGTTEEFRRDCLAKGLI